MTLSDYNKIESCAKLFKVNTKKFERLVIECMNAGLIDCCAPYWLAEEKNT